MFVKVAELVGESPHSWNDAVQSAIREASRSIRNISGVEVYNMFVMIAVPPSAEDQ
jgi:flavin-binding protein dodecin